MKRQIFESSPEATVIRSACIGAVDSYRAILDGEDHEIARHELDERLRLLRDIGIVANMHAVRSPQPLEDLDAKKLPAPSDPVRCAEYAGGQILSAVALSEEIGPPDRALLEEFESERIDGQTSYEFGLHPEVDTFFVRKLMLDMTLQILDHRTGE